jgi:hypothetical protein
MRPISATEFTVVDAPAAVTITFQMVGGTQRMRWNQAGQAPVDFAKLDVATPTAAQLEEYAGSYYSAELQNTFTLRVVDGALTVFRRGENAQRFQPRRRDEFATGPVTLRFQRDAAGAVTGYRMDMGRIRGLLFERAADAEHGERDGRESAQSRHSVFRESFRHAVAALRDEARI